MRPEPSAQSVISPFFRSILSDRTFIKSLRDIAGRIAELIDLFDRADMILVDALKKTATRAELGLEPTEKDNG